MTIVNPNPDKAIYFVVQRNVKEDLQWERRGGDLPVVRWIAEHLLASLGGPCIVHLGNGGSYDANKYNDCEYRIVTVTQLPRLLKATAKAIRARAAKKLREERRWLHNRLRDAAKDEAERSWKVEEDSRGYRSMVPKTPEEWAEDKDYFKSKSYLKGIKIKELAVKKFWDEEHAAELVR